MKNQLNAFNRVSLWLSIKKIFGHVGAWIGMGLGFIRSSRSFYYLLFLIIQIGLFQGVTVCDVIDPTSAAPADVEEKEGGVQSTKAIGAYLFVFTAIGSVLYGLPGVIGVFAYMHLVEVIHTQCVEPTPVPEKDIIAVTTASEAVSAGSETGGILLAMVTIVTICVTLYHAPFTDYLGFPRYFLGGRPAFTSFVTVATVVGNALGLELEPTVPQEPNSEEIKNPKVPRIIVQSSHILFVVAAILWCGQSLGYL